MCNSMYYKLLLCHNGRPTRNCTCVRLFVCCNLQLTENQVVFSAVSQSVTQYSCVALYAVMYWRLGQYGADSERRPALV
jgi:hypothetical protein